MKKWTFNNRGAVLPLVSILLALVLFGVAALVVDAGMLYSEKKAMVTAADAAALAGAQTLQRTTGTDISKARIVAQNLALSNGAITASAIVEVRDPGTKKARQVIQVNAQTIKNNYFAKLIGFDTTTVNSMAVATWGYVKKYEVNSFIPIFTFSSEFDKVSSGAIQYGLHGNFDKSPPNYGFVNISSGDVAGVIKGKTIVESIASPLESFSGGHESLPGGVTDRLIKAYNDYSDPILRERYMTCLVPIIDTDGFESANGISDIYDPDAPLISGKRWWDTKLTLPIKYFAYYIVEDIIVKGKTKGVGASLYKDSYSKQVYSSDPRKSTGVEYLTGGTATVFGKTVTLFDCGGSAPTASIIVGRFTGETVPDLRVISVDGDQKYPGNADAATYYRLIQ